MLNIALLITAALASAQPFQDLSFDEACKKAGKEKKVVFIDFYTTWCAPCKIMDKAVFAKKDVQAWLEKHTIALKIDAEKHEKLAERFKIMSYPSLVFVKPDGTEIDRLNGAVMAPRAFIEESEGCLSGKPPIERAKEKLAASGNKDPMAKMQYARKLIQLGKHEEALKELLWCFDEGNKHSMGFAGVRLSFLLRDIQKLGEKYPPAIEALKVRRDAAEKEVMDSDGTTISPKLLELTGLNQHLGDGDRNVDLYDMFKAKKIPNSFATNFLKKIIFSQLLEAKRYEDLGNGVDFEAEIKQRQELNSHKSTGMSAEMRKRFDKLDRDQLLKSIGEYYQILIALNRQDEAGKMADKAIELAPEAETYNLLAWNAHISGLPTQANLDQIKKAYAMSEGNNASIVDTYARILVDLKHHKEACELLAQYDAQPFDSKYDNNVITECKKELNCSPTN